MIMHAHTEHPDTPISAPEDTTDTTGIPAAIDEGVYMWEDTGPVMLARIDARLSNGVYVFRYAPIADTVSGVDMSGAFWDAWQEVKRRF